MAEPQYTCTKCFKAFDSQQDLCDVCNTDTVIDVADPARELLAQFKAMKITNDKVSYDWVGTEGHLCTACYKTYSRATEDGCCPECPEEFLVDLSMHAMRDTAIELMTKKTSRLRWKYRSLVTVPLVILFSSLGLYLCWPLLSLENSRFYRHSEDPGVMTVIIVCGTLAVFVGFRLADRLRRFIHQVPSTGLIDPPAHTYNKSVRK